MKSGRRIGGNKNVRSKKKCAGVLTARGHWRKERILQGGSSGSSRETGIRNDWENKREFASGQDDK